MKCGIGERRWMNLLNDLLSIFWSELVKLLSQLRVRGEDWRSLWDTVLDVYNLASSVSVLLQQSRNGFARVGSIGDLQLAFGVLVLCVYDHESRVAGRGSRWARADHLAEGLYAHGGCFCLFRGCNGVG